MHGNTKKAFIKGASCLEGDTKTRNIYTHDFLFANVEPVHHGVARFRGFFFEICCEMIDNASDNN